MGRCLTNEYEYLIQIEIGLLWEKKLWLFQVIAKVRIRSK